MLIATVLAIVLMVMDHRGEHLSAIRSGLLWTATPLFYLADAPGNLAASVNFHLRSRTDLEQEVQLLRDEQFAQRTQMQRLLALEAENARLRGLLASARKTRGKRMVAEIISVDLDPGSQQVMINRGAAEGVYVGQAVIDAFGVMGQVSEVSASTARVLLLTDSHHAVPVRVERTGFNAIAEGSGNTNRLRLQFVPNTTDLKVGDQLVSSGLGARFPDGYPVGTVTVVDRDPSEAYADIEVQTAAHMDRSGEVLLLWPPQDEFLPPVRKMEQQP